MLRKTVLMMIAICSVLVMPGLLPTTSGETAGIASTDVEPPALFTDAPSTPNWAVRWDGGTNSVDAASAMTADGFGNVYVTGESPHPGSSETDFATLKYNSLGSLLWAKRFPDTGTYSARAKAIAVRGGNVYVVSTRRVASRKTVLTVKYDASGNLLWAKVYAAPDDVEASSIAVDGLGNAYVAASCKKYYLTLKYSPDGMRLWAKRYGLSGDNYDQANAVALDSGGNVYVTGRMGPSYESRRVVTVKYAPSGDQLWVRRHVKPGISASEGTAIGVDKAGNVYVAGVFTPSGSACDYALLKYTATGDLVWVRSYDGPAGGDDRAVALALDTSGKVHVTGASQTASGYRSYATLKYSPAGKQLWCKRYRVGRTRSYEALAIAVDRYGNVFVTGRERNGPNGFDAVTLNYAGDGQLIWQERYNGSGNADDSPVGIAVGGRAASVYVAGSSHGTGTGLDYFVVKYLNH
jgi:hypothetical protein